MTTASDFGEHDVHPDISTQARERLTRPKRRLDPQARHRVVERRRAAPVGERLERCTDWLFALSATARRPSARSDTLAATPLT